MRYRETPPPAELAELVQVVWTVEGTPGESMRVVPDASVDLIALDGGVERVLVNGPMPRAEMITLTAPTTYGLRLVPGTLPRVGGITSLHALRGAYCVVPGPATGGPVPTQLLDWAGTLRASGGLDRNPDVDEVLAQIMRGERAPAARRVGPRQLQRLFATYVGLSPQETVGVVRQLQVVRALRSGDGGELATLAADHGYADQPHLTRTFTRLAGVPPGAYRREVADDVIVQDPAAEPPRS